MSSLHTRSRYHLLPLRSCPLLFSCLARDLSYQFSPRLSQTAGLVATPSGCPPSRRCVCASCTTAAVVCCCISSSLRQAPRRVRCSEILAYRQSPSRGSATFDHALSAAHTGWRPELLCSAQQGLLQVQVCACAGLSPSSSCKACQGRLPRVRVHMSSGCRPHRDKARAARIRSQAFAASNSATTCASHLPSFAVADASSA